ncbi:MAG: hypothetical protein ABIG71_03785 [Candidatus Uhrbacteria bacterium]
MDQQQQGIQRDPIEHFAFELIRATNLDVLPLDAQVVVATQIRDQVQQRIGIIAVQNLDDDGLDAFNTLMERDPAPEPEELQEFFAERVSGFEEKLQAALLAFADEFMQEMQTQRATAKA